MMRLAVHDLIQPLSLMMGFCDLMSDEMAPFTPEQSKRMAVIKRSQCQMDELINGIIKYEKFSVNESEMDHASFNLNTMAESVVNLLNDCAAAKSQTLRFESDLSDPFLIGDAFLLQEALTNLVSNGIKYTPDNGQIVIRTSQTDDFYILSVQDTGPGIKPDQLEQVFHPFVRLKTDSPEKGLGLGLSLVKMIAERHDGFVFVENAAGQGCNFQIQIPIDSNVAAKSEPELEPVEQEPLPMQVAFAI